jgi:hypothetical protein
MTGKGGEQDVGRWPGAEGCGGEQAGIGKFQVQTGQQLVAVRGREVGSAADRIARVWPVEEEQRRKMKEENEEEMENTKWRKKRNERKEQNKKNLRWAEREREKRHDGSCVAAQAEQQMTHLQRAAEQDQRLQATRWAGGAGAGRPAALPPRPVRLRRALPPPPCARSLQDDNKHQQQKKKKKEEEDEEDKGLEHVQISQRERVWFLTTD